MGSVTKLLLRVVSALVCALLLASCALRFPDLLMDDDSKKAYARMELIAAAINSHDAAALKAMFSAPALEQATDIDERLDSILAFFPNGGLTWEAYGNDTAVRYAPGKLTELLTASFGAIVDGVKYSLFFAEFTVNDALDPDNVGLWALAVTPSAQNWHLGYGAWFNDWTDSFEVSGNGERGYSGVYMPPDNTQLSQRLVAEIVDSLNSAGAFFDLRAEFSDYAQNAYATEVEEGIDSLVALLTEGMFLRDQVEIVPTVRESTENGGATTLLLSTYRVSAEGVDYWMVVADFTQNAIDPDNVGLYAIGVAPLTEAGDSAAEQALFAWADSVDVEGSVPPGIFIAQ